MDKPEKGKIRWYALPALPTLLIVLAAVVLLVVVFAQGNYGPLAYFSYLFSTYALIVGMSGLSRLFPLIGRTIANSRLMARLHRNQTVSRYLDDVLFRTRINLYFGVAVNFAYIFIKLFSGVYYRSEWLIVFALYYTVLTGLRVSLANYVRRNEVRQDLAAEYRRFRFAGALLVPMNLLLTVIIARMISHNDTFDYPGVLIYGIAAYVFYAVILAAVNVFRFRRHGSPVISAVKIVSLTAALVALLSLEAAMLTRFGGDDDLLFRSRMLGLSGLGVCAIILGMSGYMIVHATNQLKKFSKPAKR